MEIGTEELPAGFIEPALKQLIKMVFDMLTDNRIDHWGKNDAWGTPRRLTLHVAGVEEHQPDKTQTVMGPANNAPVEHQKGFAQKHGKTVEDLLTIKTEKGERLGVEVFTPGKLTKELLSQMLPQIIQSIVFPKSMRWGGGDFRFARPIHWIMALYGKDTVVFELGDIKSDHYSYGHRFLSNKRIFIPSPGDYRNLLTENHVLVDQSHRHEKIVEQLENINQQLAKTYSGAQVIKDEELLKEVTYLVEYPIAVMGEFDKEFLKLPQEVLSTTLKHHQKCFSVVDGNNSLLPLFVTISNMPDKKGYIRKGNERVIRARLSDARFFFEEDQKTSLESRLEKLKSMIFQKKLGSYYDKAKRLEELAGYIAHRLGGNQDEITYARQAGLLCKCDLVTEMVGEFPELQGIIGGHYAHNENYDIAVCNAIKQQYNFDQSNVPTALPSKAVNIADKIDSIVGYIGIGILPSGSADPYAIRRQTMAIIYMLSEETFSLKSIVEEAIVLYAGKIKRKPEEGRSDIYHLFRQRLEAYFKVVYRYYLVDAVLCAGFDDVLDTRQRLDALNALSQAADFDALMVAFRRVARIIPAGYKPERVKPALFEEEAEKLLYSQFQQIKAQLEQLLDNQDYPGALSQLLKLKPHVDRFFDDVMVMADDKTLQNNRLALLSEIKAPFSRIADFSKIVA